MITNLANLWAAQGWLPRFPTPARALHAGGFYRRESCHCPGLPRVGAWTSLPKRESISTCFDMDLWPLWVPEQIDDAEVPQLEFWTADGVAIYTAWGGSCWCPTVQDGAHCPGASRDLCNLQITDSAAQTPPVSVLWALLVSSVPSQQFGLFTALIYPWKKRPVGDLFISHNHPETSICLRPRTDTKQQWLWKHTNKYWADTEGFSE